MIRTSGLILILLLTGCLAPRDPVEMRYFVLEPKTSNETMNGVRLRSVTTALHLNEPLVWRVSDVEIQRDEIHRWAAPLASLIEDTTRRSLDPGPERSATLELHVTAFESTPPPRRGRVEILATIERPDRSRSQRTFEATAPLTTEDAAGLAAALRDALDQTLASIRRWASKGAL